MVDDARAETGAQQANPVGTVSVDQIRQRMEAAYGIASLVTGFDFYEVHNTENPESTRETLWPLLLSGDPAMQEVTDRALIMPEMRVLETKVKPGGIVHYYGYDFVVDGLREGDFSFYEINVGLLGVLDNKGNPVGVLDVHPYSRKRWPLPGSTLKQPLTPPEDLFYQAFARPSSATKEQIMAFLKDYPAFFAQKGEFAIKTGFAYQDRDQVTPLINLSTLPLETKFWLFQLFQQGIPEADKQAIYQFFQKHSCLGGFILGAASDHPAALIPMVRLGNTIEPRIIQLLEQRVDTWLYHAPRLKPAEIAKVTEDTFTQDFAREGESVLPAEILAWAFEVEGFSFDIAITILPEQYRTAENSNLVLDIAHAIQRRSRAMATAFAEFTDVHPDYLTSHPDECHYFRDGIRAQTVLLSLLASKGVEGLAESIHLPPFFFKQYRATHAGIYGKAEVMDSLLELWQKTYLIKEEGETYLQDMPAIIRQYWNRHNEILAAGQQTGESAVEIIRDESIITQLNLPKESTVIDFGPWNGQRRLKPLIEILKKRGINPYQVVGIDISDVPDPISEMDLKQMTFIEAARQPDLIGAFDLAKADWSAANDEATVKGQILNFASFSRCLKEGGVLILDTPFPEGEGSYEAVLQAYKALYPDAAEGRFDFEYQSVDQAQPKPFMLYYYEILFKLLEDAGFEILNLPADREDYLNKVISGEEDISTHREDAYRSACWKAQAKPRITLVAKKINNPEDTDNLVLRKLFLEAFTAS